MAAARDQRVRTIKEWGKARLRNLFEVGQHVGVDVLPRHFYSEIPDIRALKSDRRWQRPYSMVGVAGTDIDGQLEWLRETCPRELAATLPALGLYEYAAMENGAVGFGPIETDLLYCFVRTRTPRRVVQIGAGASTSVVLRAAKEAGVQLDLTCVDPYPTDYLRRLGSNGAITLRDVPVQDLAASEFAALGPGDLLFIDSTHTVSPGSDVNYLILEVLPRLANGVFVHFHDVTMPYDYAPLVLSHDLFFWSESVLLHAYLADNPRFEIRFACALIHDRALERAQEIIPTYNNPMKTDRGVADANADGDFPASIWLEVVADPSG
ncbi:class I SAM-dependent methyltransferase [Mycobacterium sp. IDR2000157661]|uniref:class I SAM-dependent methyltransferase n=1 Tax=Mycobacterium sp. IDR2000157661 TaxID=2867005 RepID=UPI001EEB3C96|nr:class I SAM-dependent methyltransferase [Mycobacterium sp. IDR2000157661]ULE33614.1 class I SAM-dependent methyltransferase [Mycobacterium sp. IDR2000157661]